MEQNIQYQVIRSERKTICISIRQDGKVLVRAPLFCSERTIQAFICSKEKWIKKHLELINSNCFHSESVDDTKREEYMQKAKKALPELVKKYAYVMDVTPTKITITGARTRYGSCSSKNAICFSWRLMAYPEEAIEYVVVHELAHIRYHHHQKSFYDFVAKVLPDWKKRASLLK